MSIDLSGLDIFVAQDLLNDPDVRNGEKFRSESVSKCVRVDRPIKSVERVSTDDTLKVARAEWT